ncbi:MAG TPA: hypothetical protein VNW92_00215 [Polyangiaceae bacterium]|nr:hypothetical protein [Polyangiaceae bacterium]
MARWSIVRGWGLAALLGCGASFAAGCQDGYPIAATVCDDWCDQTRRVACGSYDPAMCVMACERAGLSRTDCADSVQQALACLRGKTDAELACQAWAFTGPTPCSEQQTTALACGSQNHRGTLPGAP